MINKDSINKLFEAFKRIFFNNLAIKVLALFIAIGLWAGLVTQDPKLTRPKYFENVPLSIVGEESLKRNGLIISNDFDQQPIYVSFTADVPQREYENIKPSSFYPRIDLSSIDSIGKVKVPIQTYTSQTIGSVSAISPSQIEVDVDKYVTQYRVPVQYEQIGNFAEGIYGTEPFIDPSTVQVSGPLSLVYNINKAVVSVDVSKYSSNEGIVKTSAKLKLVDSNNKEIKSDMISVTSESVRLRNVLITQQLYNLKKYKLDTTGLIVGEPQSGYYIKGISINPSVVAVAAGSEVLANLDNIYVNDTINIDKLSKSFTKTININIPSETVYASAKTAVVSVDIEPIIREKSFENISLHVLGKPDDKTIEFDSKKISIFLKGPINEISQIRSSYLNPTVSIDNLNEGEYELPISLVFNEPVSNDIEYKLFPSKINVHVKKK